MMEDIKNRTVLITGASKGIGKAIACAFACQGARLHLVSESDKECGEVESICKREGASEINCHCCDLTNSKQCHEMLSKVGHVDILINNAGIFGPSGEEQGPLEGNPDEWEHVIQTNLNAPMRLTRHFAPKMVSKGHGWIINIGDVEGIHSGPKHAVYAASKAGLRAYTLSCYESLRHKNVNVVLISPGNVAGTEMARATSKTGGQGAIKPEDVAEAAMFCFRVSDNCVPSEIVLKAVQPHGRAEQ